MKTPIDIRSGYDANGRVQQMFGLIGFLVGLGRVSHADADGISLVQIAGVSRFFVPVPVIMNQLA